MCSREKQHENRSDHVCHIVFIQLARLCVLGTVSVRVHLATSEPTSDTSLVTCITSGRAIGSCFAWIAVVHVESAGAPRARQMSEG